MSFKLIFDSDSEEEVKKKAKEAAGGRPEQEMIDAALDQASQLIRALRSDPAGIAILKRTSTVLIACDHNAGHVSVSAALKNIGMQPRQLMAYMLIDALAAIGKATPENQGVIMQRLTDGFRESVSAVVENPISWYEDQPV